MHRTLLFALVSAFALSTSWGGDVAVSIRYLHPGKAKSHAALFLFNTNGKLIRQLTTPTDSQDGTESYVLDLAARRIVQISPNGEWILPWPGHPGFFAEASSRYEDLGDERTVNCNYLDLYDSKLKRTRFGHAVGRFHGGSVLVSGEKPFNIVDSDFAEEKAP